MYKLLVTKVHKRQHWMCHWFSQTQTIQTTSRGLVQVLLRTRNVANFTNVTVFNVRLRYSEGNERSHAPCRKRQWNYDLLGNYDSNSGWTTVNIAAQRCKTLALLL